MSSLLFTNVYIRCVCWPFFVVEHTAIIGPPKKEWIYVDISIYIYIHIYKRYIYISNMICLSTPTPVIF